MKFINIRQSYLLTMLLGTVLLIAIFCVALRIAHTRQMGAATRADREASLSIENEIENASNELAEEAHFYADTGNPEFKRYYSEILAIRNGSKARPQNYSAHYWDFVAAGLKQDTVGDASNSGANQVNLSTFTEDEKNILNSANVYLDALIKLEVKAMNAVDGLYEDSTGNYTVHDKPNLELARGILNGKEYLQNRGKFLEVISLFLASVDGRTRNAILFLQGIQKTNVIMLEFLILFGIFCLIAAYFYGQREIVKPISKLFDQVNQIINQIYTARNNVKVNNELGVLANTMNTMCESILKDVNEHERMENEIRHREEHIRSLIENSPIGTTIIDPDGRFLQVNEALCQMLGYSKNEFLRLTYNEVIYPDDLEKERTLQKQFLQGVIATYQLDLRTTHKDGRIVWISLNIFGIKNDAGKLDRLIGQFQDITERKVNEREMLELNRNFAATIEELKKREFEETLINKMNDMLQICLTVEETYPRIDLIAQQLFPDMSGGLALISKDNESAKTVMQWGKSKILATDFIPSNCLGMRSGTNIFIEDPKRSVPCPHYISQPEGAYMELPLIVQAETFGMMYLYAPKGASISVEQQQLAIIFTNVIKLALANIRLREKLHRETLC